MILTIVGIVLFLSCFVLRIDRAFFVAFCLQNTFFLANNSLDLGTYSLLIIFIRLVVTQKGLNRKKFLSFFSARLVVIWFIASLVWSFLSEDNAVGYIRAIFRCTIGLYVFISILSTKKNKSQWVYLFLVPLLINLVNTTLIAQGIHPYIETYFDYGRLSARGITGQKVNINTFAYSILCLFIAFLVSLDHQRFRNKLLIGFISIQILIVLGFLGSRFAILSFLVVLVVTYFNKISLIFSTSLLLLFLGMVDLKSVTIPFIGEAANKRLNSIQSEEFAAADHLSRGSLARAGWLLFTDNFVLGVGTGGVAQAMSGSKYAGVKIVPHNAFLSLFIQYGFFIGSIMIFYLLVNQIKITVRDFKLGCLFFALFIFSNLAHDYLQVTLAWMTMIYIEILSKIRSLKKARRLPALADSKSG